MDPLGSGSKSGKGAGTGHSLGYSGNCQYFGVSERSRWLMDMTAAVKHTEPELRWLPWRDFWKGLLNKASKVQKSVHNNDLGFVKQ